MLGEWHDVEWELGQGTVELPRFTTESSLELDELLGLRLEPGRDLDELIEGPGDKALGRILQRARVDVDEAGTRAAATTAVTMRTVSMPMNPFHLTFDRPFTWAIEHAPTGTAAVRRARGEPDLQERLMRYASMGRIPAKRHVQFRDEETENLLVEEVMGFEGFSGNESILYHLFSPCRVKDVGEFNKIELEEWVPDTHVHRLTHTMDLGPSGDSVLGRRVLQYNADVEIGMCVPEREADYFYRDGEGDEVIFVHEGSGVVETIFGTLSYRKHDYVVIPRGTTYRFRFDEPQRWLTFYTPGEIETPNRYRNRYGQLLEHAPFSQRDFHPPAELVTHRSRDEHHVKVRVRGGYQDYVLDYHPLDVIGWDGYVYPYTFNIADFEPKAGRLHQPPPAHQTFQGPNFVICSFCPRMLDWDPMAVALPYHHSNVQSEEVMYYVDGDYAARKGVEIGSFTLHPTGLPHGPQPGTVEKSLGIKETSELAVMCDTFRPLKLTTLSRDLDDPSYAYSWYEDPVGA